MVQSETYGNFAKHSNEVSTFDSRNELIPIIQNQDQQFVDARHLHKWLKVKTQFAPWITGRIKEYDFKEGMDFRKTQNFDLSFTKPFKDYLLTFDMAKELSMIERNEQGRLIRRWFIAKEKELRAAKPTYSLPPYNTALKQLKALKINGQKLFKYKDVLTIAGYSHPSGRRKAQYANHFIVFGNKNYITEEYANHLIHSRAVFANRKVLVAAQGVLPLDFGDTTALIGRRL